MDDLAFTRPMRVKMRGAPVKCPHGSLAPHARLQRCRLGKGKDATWEKYGRGMTAEAGKMDPVIGRDDEIDRVVCILSRRTKNSAMLVGAPGVGKTAIAEGLAQRIAAGAVPAQLVGARSTSARWLPGPSTAACSSA